MSRTGRKRLQLHCSRPGTQHPMSRMLTFECIQLLGKMNQNRTAKKTLKLRQVHPHVIRLLAWQSSRLKVTKRSSRLNVTPNAIQMPVESITLPVNQYLNIRSLTTLLIITSMTMSLHQTSPLTLPRTVLRPPTILVMLVMQMSLTAPPIINCIARTMSKHAIVMRVGVYP